MRTRIENWGHIEYDQELDEFHAIISDECSTIRIDRPLSAGCLVTGRCNLACAFCYGNDEALPRKELAVVEWEAIFQHMRSWGLMRVDLSGGEPTIRKDVSAIARAALQSGLNVVLSTNGLLLDDKGLAGLPGKIRIHVSLDSGFEDVHASSRRLRSLLPSSDSLSKACRFISKCLERGYRVRVMTCLGKHNEGALFELGERIATLGLHEWNISRVLNAGRAQQNYARHWQIDDGAVIEQVHDMRAAYPWVRIRFSDRTEQDGYFLLVLPDGSLATQYTHGRDKVVLGRALDISLLDLRKKSAFNLSEHARKWIAATLQSQETT